MSRKKLRHLSPAWSEGWMRVFLETAVDAIVIIDSKGLIESFNPAAERMFGYRDLDVVGLNVSTLMPAPYAHEHDGYVENYLRTGHRKIIGIGREVEGLRKDGTIFPLHLSVAAIQHEGATRFTGVMRDLTRERAARAREANIARIVETSVNEIYVFDADSLRYAQVNDGARANLGYSMGELSGMTPLDLERGVTRTAFEERVAPLRRGERDRVVLRSVHRRKDGTTYPVEAHVQTGVFSGRPVFVAFVLDSSERDELQGRFLHAQKLEAIGRLTGALAHDFNNLLMGIMSGSRMIAERVAHDEPAARMLAEIQEEARRGAGITRQLLDFSRKRKYQLRPCDLNAIVEGARSLFQKLLGEDIELQITGDAQGFTILADPAKLDQILMNLVVNARDAMTGGGTLRIDTLRRNVRKGNADLAPGPYLVVAVTDDGCGMDAATKAQVFEPFFTTKEAGRGTGLGLSTVFGLTREFRGHVEVESELGRGTTFRLWFPAADEVAEDPVEEPACVATGGIETILLVEDAALVRAGIRGMLRGLGYNVLDAGSPERALTLVETMPRVDLLLTDMVMPGMNGAELAAAIRARRPDLRVLFMSAYSDEALIEQGRIQAGVPILEKPFEPDELARRVREVLDDDAA
jgi:PAS domain S-box-containing protein